MVAPFVVDAAQEAAPPLDADDIQAGQMPRSGQPDLLNLDACLRILTSRAYLPATVTSSVLTGSPALSMTKGGHRDEVKREQNALRAQAYRPRKTSYRG